MFRGCKTEDMPPHVYSLAQTAYRSLVETRRDQSLIFMGRSGSGKTTSFKHALNYFALAAGMSLHTPCCCSSPSSFSLSSSCCYHCALWADLVLSLPHQKLQFDVRLAHLHLAHTNLSWHFALFFSQFYYNRIIYDVYGPYMHSLIYNCYQPRSSGGLHLPRQLRLFSICQNYQDQHSIRDSSLFAAYIVYFNILIYRVFNY